MLASCLLRTILCSTPDIFSPHGVYSSIKEVLLGVSKPLGFETRSFLALIGKGDPEGHPLSVRRVVLTSRLRGLSLIHDLVISGFLGSFDP